MEKILIYVGDSFTASAITDYEWLVKNNIIDDSKIRLIDFIKNLFLFNKKDSIFKISLKIKNENSWTNRLAKKINLKYYNLSAIGSSWQSTFNQILYAILNNKDKEIIFIIGCIINERILTNKYASFLTEEMKAVFLYDQIDMNKHGEYLLDVYSFSRKNRINTNADFLYKKEELELLNNLFNKKIFSIYNLQAIINILNLISNYNFFFLPTWYETFKEQLEEICDDKEILETFIYSKIPKEQLSLKSPLMLKEMKINPYSPHPSFDSQELIAEYYFDFLKNKT